MYIIWNLLATFPQFIITAIVMAICLQISNKKLFFAEFVFFQCAVHVLVLSIFPSTTYVSAAIVLLSSLAMIMIRAKDHWKVKLLLYTLYYTIVVLMELVFAVILEYIVPIGYSQVTEFPEFLYFAKILYCGILIFPCMLLVTVWKRFWRREQTKNDWILLVWLFSFFQMVMIIFMIYMYIYNASMEIVLRRFFSFFSIFYLTGNMLMILILYHQRKSELDNTRRIYLERELDSQYQTWKELIQAQQKKAKLYHDFRNQLQTIYALLLEKKYLKASQYAQELVQIMQKEGTGTYCHDEILNAVLQLKAAQCSELGIDFQTELRLEKEFLLPKPIICSLFANILDNAIYAAAGTLSVLQPKVLLKVYQQGNFLSIYCWNSVVEKKPGQEKSFHWGLLIIQDIVEQHDGQMSVNSQKDFFEITAALKIRENL